MIPPETYDVLADVILTASDRIAREERREPPREQDASRLEEASGA